MIHSERDLFSSVAFFAKKKKGWTKGFMWGDFLFFFFLLSPWRTWSGVILWLEGPQRYTVSTARWAGGLHQITTQKKSAPMSVSTFTFPVFPLHCQAEKIITNDGGLETKQQKKKQQTTVKLPELLVSLQAVGGEGLEGGQAVVEALLWPHWDPEEPSQDENREMDEENNPGDFCVKRNTHAFWSVWKQGDEGFVFFHPFLGAG